MAQKRRHPFFLWRPLETGSGRGSEDRGPNSPRSRPASLMDRSRRNSWSTRRSKLASGRRAPKKVHSTWINNTCIYIIFPTWFLLLLSPDKMNKSNEREIFIKRIIVQHSKYSNVFENGFNHVWSNLRAIRVERTEKKRERISSPPIFASGHFGRRS